MFADVLKKAAERLREASSDEAVQSTAEVLHDVITEDMPDLMNFAAGFVGLGRVFRGGPSGEAAGAAAPKTSYHVGSGLAPTSATDGRFDVTHDGQLQETAGDGPAIFYSQKQAAVWILGVGNKLALSQAFEVATHARVGQFVVQARDAKPAAPAMDM